MTALVGCSAIDSGTITGKAYEPASSWTQMTCAGYNSNGTCFSYVPITYNDPEHWRFDIKKDDDTGWVYVSETTYNEYEIGDYFE